MAVPSGQSIAKFANSLMDYLVDVMIDNMVMLNLSDTDITI